MQFQGIEQLSDMIACGRIAIRGRWLFFQRVQRVTGETLYRKWT